MTRGQVVCKCNRSHSFRCTKIKSVLFQTDKDEATHKPIRYELASISVAQSILSVPMPLPGAFASHFCKELSAHEEAFFRRSAHCWAFVVVPFEFPFVFVIKRWREAVQSMYSDQVALVLDSFNACFGYLRCLR